MKPRHRRPQAASIQATPHLIPVGTHNYIVVGRSGARVGTVTPILGGKFRVMMTAQEWQSFDSINKAKLYALKQAEKY